MPTTPSRARKWIKSKKATPFWKKGIFCVRLNIEPSDNRKQDIALGIDPGSKKEGFTVKSNAHTYLNIQADAIQHVKANVENRKNMRKARRRRNTPCKATRHNRACRRKVDRLSPSTKARWQWKLIIINWLNKMFPINYTIVEDIKAVSKGERKWDKSFSPLEHGKQWFYSQIQGLITKQGYETKQLRDELGLNKCKNKLSNSFDAHCVDSWVLANNVVGGNVVDNKEMLLIVPIIVMRRELHKMQPSKKGLRLRRGGTMSLGFKKGSLVKHIKHGVTYVGGTSAGRISLHSVLTGVRLCQNAKTEDCKFLTYNGRRAFAL